MKDLRNELLQSNTTVTALSRASKISRQTIYDIMRGAVRPKIPTVKALCSVLNLDYKEYIPY